MMSENAVKIGEGKVQRIGSSFYILIPSLWRRDRKVREGDVFEVFSDGGPELVMKSAQDDGGGRE
jgi:bifunctional DNA-binding transcriptional regulator/antitoxin component of YhaV-PrlF toxin-antitoxin module